MATNPMQKKARNSFLLGLLVMLIIAIIVVGTLYMVLFRDQLGVKKEEGELTAYVYKLKSDVSSGELISFDKVEEVVTTTRVTPSDSIASKIKNVNGQIQDIGFPADTYRAKTDLKAGTVLSQSVLYQNEETTDDIRYVEYNMLMPYTLLSVGDYVDIRFTMPSGQDYIVLSKKEVKTIQGDTIGFHLTELDILTLECAIVEGYIMSGSSIYLAQYVEPGLQQAAIPTYPVNEEVFRQIENNANIVEQAKRTFESRYRTNLRNDYINNDLSQYEAERRANTEEGVRQESEKAKAAREEYLAGLIAPPTN